MRPGGASRVPNTLGICRRLGLPGLPRNLSTRGSSRLIISTYPPGIAGFPAKSTLGCHVYGEVSPLLRSHRPEYGPRPRGTLNPAPSGPQKRSIPKHSEPCPPGSSSGPFLQARATPRGPPVRIVYDSRDSPRGPHGRSAYASTPS